MATKVREVMTTDPVTLPASTSAASAAQHMRDKGIGDVLVEEDGTLRGIVTDRDLTVRVLAAGIEPDSITLGEVCTTPLTTIDPEDEFGEAVATMRAQAVRRVPVVDDGLAVGVLSIGDLAVARDPDSALSDISAAPGNN